MPDDPRPVAPPSLPERMRAVRLLAPGGPEHLSVDQVTTPRPGPGEALVRVHAAAITPYELDWPVGRLPAIPSYELSGVVAALGADVDDVAIGQPVYALLDFDHDGAAADFVAVPADVLAPAPAGLDHVHRAAVPLAALTAWQGLFEHGGLTEGRRVVITGALGGVGQFATQLARRCGATVVGVTSDPTRDRVRLLTDLGAHEVVGPGDLSAAALGPVDLVLDTVGGELLAQAQDLVRGHGALLSAAEEPAGQDGVDSRYFLVESSRPQLRELTRLIEAGQLRVTVDSRFPLADARRAFARSLARGKNGKVVLDVED